MEEKETGYTHDYTRKSGVIYSEIFLPANAPQEYQNREILWNEVQKVEKASDAQLAREIEVALPVELSREEQITLLQNYIAENFTSAGECLLSQEAGASNESPASLFRTVHEPIFPLSA